MNMNMEGEGCSSSSSKKRGVPNYNNYDFTQTLFSWSLDDISNQNLFVDKVVKIPESFESVNHYFGSFVYPLLEETRAQLFSSVETISRAPFSEVVALEESKPYGSDLYDVKVDYWRNRFSNSDKGPYKTLPGDILVLADAKPETASDLQWVGKTWSLVCVKKITEDENDDDTTSISFKVSTSQDFQMHDNMNKSLFLIFLTNITPKRRNWNSLHMNGNLKIVQKILCNDSVVEENCELCSLQSEDIWDEKIAPCLLSTSLSSILNDSQVKALSACLQRICCEHKAAIELIWGPPGTGKTKTVSMLLFTLLRMNCRTLVCTPTNVAIIEVASRVVKLVKDSFETNSRRDIMFFQLGDILLFGNNERLKVGAELEEIYLDYRIERLAECFGLMTGWRRCFASMVEFLEDCVSHYHIFLENELMKSREETNENETEEKKKGNVTEGSEVETFLEFVRERFKSIATSLRKCILIFCTHMPKKYILEKNFQDMEATIDLLDSFETLLFQDSLVSEDLEELFSHPIIEDLSQEIVAQNKLLHKRSECHSILRILQSSLTELALPSFTNKESLRHFCLENSSLIFCTASSSYKLHSVKMEPLNLLVIDEAAQLKESESTIPLQLLGIQHAILIGDECQLPAMVQSTVSDKADFGRSLFQRLTSLGHPKHLLNIQYRMHPAISMFPNSHFYHNKILDGPNVKRKSYGKNYLPGPMYCPFSFINIIGGKEEFSDVGYSRRNMVEVSVVMKILKNLYKAWTDSKKKLSIGVVSPYMAQVVAIQEKLEGKYQSSDDFVVKVKSIDGFQGGEEDIIIISTVRSDSGGSIGFIAKPQRINVALTRARHCLWILGNEKTLTRSESIWKTLVCDAKDRQCFFNADEDKDLAKAILDVKKEFDELDELLNPESILFRSQIWKVTFSDNFLKSFKKLTPEHAKKSVINLLLKLSSGWRPKRKVDSVCDSSMQIIKQYKVEGRYIVCTIDIAHYSQVLKIWDIMPLEEVPKLLKRLDNIFVNYTDDYISRCKEKCLDGKLEVPKTWPSSANIVRVKNLSNIGNESDLNGVASDGRSYVENSKVNESLLLMKFYSLSPGIVSHLLSDRDGRELDLPFEVTDEQLEMILFPRSTFIHGRSGTGKTTILTMKLFQKEKLHHMAMEAWHGVETSTNRHISRKNEVEKDVGDPKNTILRQLFVTVSPKLCFAVKRHISHLKSSTFGGKYPVESSLIDVDDIDDVVQFKDITNSLVDIPTTSYPLAITFHKFLMMLDGTVGTSYFDRFNDIRKHADGQIQSSKSGNLQTLIRTKEVTYDKFSSFYWPHFNEQQTKKLDSSRVFTEIVSHIKGGLRTMEVDAKLTREDYVRLSETRFSTLADHEREMVYDIFENYERMKAENGEFDLADLVMDILHRLKKESYEGDEMDYVYIDEVQDLTMSQIALFKYICKNVEEGFVFSGDTAQTIARGIDFRFQDIRSLFYNKFVLESRSSEHDGRNEKGQISEILSLSQNFRTHAGVLKLAQSIIDLLYRFFPHSIDILKPETSMIYGEPPVLLESESNENVIVTIFGNSTTFGNIVGFGAQQVILVRDDCVRKEIANYVGKQALVLTIVECKGLEFQDVLLYNFFGSSPQKNKWRVVYQYMEEQNLLDSESPRFSVFKKAKHSALCSELKQLYVAITRTRQRLWIWENTENFSKPMFDYWKKRGLVQVRQLDDSLARAMQVASSPEEWRSQGIKLFYENNYEMATMCFERAGDAYWEKRTKATCLKAAADRVRSSNPEEANNILREAAEIFEAIGKADYAARCFFDLGEYERAGRIYLEKFEESELERAAECFNLAGCYELAANVYARGSFVSECLSVCFKGELFEMGLQYIQHWKRHANMDVSLVRRSEELNKIEQDFLESCARRYHELRDNKSMMKFVKAFNSEDLKRNFLKSLNCFDELLLLEEESGNFVDAANIAKMRGDIILAADLLQKAGNFTESTTLTLDYLVSNSLWSHGSKGWPLKQFTNKNELVEKAKSFAKNVSNQFYEFVCTEAEILSNDQKDLFVLHQKFKASKRHQSNRGEILSSRKILDIHLRSNASKYVREDELVLDLLAYSEDTLSESKVSVETLVYFWNYWKDKIVDMLEYFGNSETQGATDYSYEDFWLSYFGVLKHYESQHHNRQTVYFLLNPDADWVGTLDSRYSNSSGNMVSISIHHLVSTARSYWSSELLSVGMKVLNSLEALHKQSVKNSLLVFCQFRPLTHIFEVAKFLLDSEFTNCRHYDSNALQKFIKLSTDCFFGYIFPLDWRESLRMNMISLRRTEVCRSIVEKAISNYIGLNCKLSYGKMGSMAVMILGSGKLANEPCKKVAEKCYKNSPWQEFLKSLSEKNMELGSVKGHNNERGEMCLVQNFHGALLNTYGANWRGECDYISPACFLYLVERLLILVSCFKGYVLTTKSSFVDWLIHQEGDTYPTSCLLTDVLQCLRNVHAFIVQIVEQLLLYDMRDTMGWIRKYHRNVKDCHSLVILRLVVILCLLHLNFGDCERLLCHLLSQKYITDQLPWEFCYTLWGSRRRNFLDINVNVIAEAFKKIGNPLVIVSLRENCSRFSCQDAIFVDMKVSQSTDDILGILFPKIEAFKVHAGTATSEATVSKELVSSECLDEGKSSDPPSNSQNINEDNPMLNLLGHILKIIRTLDSVVDAGDQKNIVFNDPKIKVDVEKCIHLLTTATDGFFQKNPENEDKSQLDEAASMLEELKQLYAALDESEMEVKNNISTIREVYKKLQSKRPTMEPFLNELLLQQSTILKGKAVETGIASGGKYDELNADFLQQSTILKGKAVETGIASGGKYDEQNTDSKTDECSNSDKGDFPAIVTQGNTRETESKRTAKSRPKKNKKRKGGKKNK